MPVNLQAPVPEQLHSVAGVRLGTDVVLERFGQIVERHLPAHRGPQLLPQRAPDRVVVVRPVGCRAPGRPRREPGPGLANGERPASIARQMGMGESTLRKAISRKVVVPLA